MRKIEVRGLGVFVEIYDTNNRLNEIEMLKEAEKSIKRVVLAHEAGAIRGISGQSDTNGL